jgi:hypothetical protein
MNRQIKQIYRGYNIITSVNSLNVVDEVKIFKDVQLINDGFAETEDAIKYVDNYIKLKQKK